MDGVLVDVSRSYMLAIKKTVEFFLGSIIPIAEVEAMKQVPGNNDDFDCTRSILLAYGIPATEKALIKKFQEFYQGKNFDGLIKNERFLLREDTLKALSSQCTLAIFTGRDRKESTYALEKAEAAKYFKTVITAEDVKKKKPDPEGLLKLLDKYKPQDVWYVGDSVDDAAAARKAEVPFVGVIPPGTSNPAELKSILLRKGAARVLDSIEQIQKVIG